MGAGRFAENHTSEFWSQMHNSLEHLHGRPWLSDAGEQYRGMPDCHTADALWFLLGCRANEFFDFIELSFKLDVAWRVPGDSKEIVEAINEILRSENAPFQLTPQVEIREDNSHLPEGVRSAVRRIASYPKIIRVEDEVVHPKLLYQRSPS